MADGKIVEIDADGVISFVWCDSLAPLVEQGTAIIDRASTVEPVGNRWEVDLGPVGGPKVGGFVKRSDAIAFELDWIRENLGL